MINIFNRKLICTTFNEDLQAKTTGALSANHIPYVIKAVNRNMTAAAELAKVKEGTVWSDASVAFEFKIYVHKNDYSKAVRVIKF